MPELGGRLAGAGWYSPTYFTRRVALAWNPQRHSARISGSKLEWRSAI